MHSPFPGMDPYLEHPARWPDVHLGLISTLRRQLQAALRPRYLVRAEERVYLSTSETTIRPDVTVLEGPGAGKPPVSSRTGAPVLIPTVMGEEVRERFLEVRLTASGEVVAVIEVLSPTNKRPNSRGRRLYLQKREELLLSGAHLVEIDLLRGGERVPMAAPLPEAAYYVIVSDAGCRPQCEVYPIGLREALPVFSLPLGGGERIDVDLGHILAVLYESSAYDLELDYDGPCEPPLSDEEGAWARGCVQAWRDGRD